MSDEATIQSNLLVGSAFDGLTPVPELSQPEFLQNELSKMTGTLQEVVATSLSAGMNVVHEEQQPCGLLQISSSPRVPRLSQIELSQMAETRKVAGTSQISKLTPMTETLPSISFKRTQDNQVGQVPEPQAAGIQYDYRGSHLLLTLYGCDPAMLNDDQLLREITNEAALATGATVLQLVSHKFSPQGVTALAVLAESHASVHTYPESGVLFWDCFTCGQTCKPELSIAVLVQALKPQSINKQMINRE